MAGRKGRQSGEKRRSLRACQAEKVSRRCSAKARALVELSFTPGSLFSLRRVCSTLIQGNRIRKMARRSSDGAATEVGKKRKLEDGERESATQHKKARAGSDAVGLPQRSSGKTERTKSRKMSNGHGEPTNGGLVMGAHAQAGIDGAHQNSASGKLSHLTEEEKAHRRQRRAAKKEKRQRRAVAAAAEKKDDPLKALAAKQSRKRLAGHDQPLWTLSSPTAGRMLDQDPVFVRSSSGIEYLVVATESQVQLLSQETSTVIKTSLAPEGSHVRCFAPSVMEDGVVFIAFSNGYTHKWEVDVDESAIQIGRAIGSGNVKAFAELPYFGYDRNRRLCLTRDGETHSISLGDRPLFETSLRLDHLLVVDEQYVVVTGRAGVVIGFNKNATVGVPDFTWIQVPVLKPITCADARLMPPSENEDGIKAQRHGLSLLLGYADGEIHLFEDVSGLFDGEGKLGFSSPRTLHWHRNAVASAKFSRDGNYIISGGKETVLVLWQLATGNKSYLPHLTSAILHIVVNTVGDRYALQMGDNSVMVLSTSELKPVANFAGLQLAPLQLAKKPMHSMAKQDRTAAVIHTRDSDRLLLTVPASQPKDESDITTRPFLQTFDLVMSRHVARQALTRNNVTDFGSTPDGVPIQPPDVHLLQISRDGRWLATVDQWMPPAADLAYLASDTPGLIAEERRKRREVYLKFWSWDQQQDLWTLATRVDAPHARASGMHGAGKVFSLIANPSSNEFATIGEDGCVHLWRAKFRVRNGMRVKSPNGEDLVEWTCKRTVDLAKELVDTDSLVSSSELPIATEGLLAYSEDGSVIAAATTHSSLVHSPLIHFIDTTTGDATPKTNMSITNLTNFGFLERYFVVVARKEVHVWDLITETLSEHSRLPGGNAQITPKLSMNQTGRTFAVAAGANVSIYDVSVGKWVLSISTATEIASLLSKGRTYIVLSIDASVRMLSPGATNHRQHELPASYEIVDNEAEKEGLAAPAAVDLLSANTTEGYLHGDRSLMLEDTEDDRPVVRPEELATIFDVGQSFALPPVKDMFGAVVGLFGRKPRVISPFS
nr:u3 small nucleolar rna-associated protein 17 [Quercus suber]